MAINISVGIFVTSEGFTTRFLKFSFHFYILSSRLATFKFAFKTHVLLPTLFIACHAYRDCLSSTEFLILLVRPWIYSCCLLYVISHEVFFKFLCTDIWWISFIKWGCFLLVIFSLIAIAFHGTLHFALGLVEMNSAYTSIWVETKFLFSSFGVWLRNHRQSVKLVSYSYRINISNIAIGEWVSVILWSFKCLCLNSP